MKRDCCSQNEPTIQGRWLSIALCCLPGLIAVGIGMISIRLLGRLIMDLNTFVLLLVGLACPVGMGLMMWMMNKNMNQNADNLQKNDELPSDLEDYLAQLRLRRHLIDAEIAELEAQHPEAVSGSLAKHQAKTH